VYVLDVDRPEDGWRQVWTGEVTAIAADASRDRFALAAEGGRVVILEGSREVLEVRAGAKVGDISLASGWLVVTTSSDARSALTRVFDAATGEPIAVLPRAGAASGGAAMARRRDGASDVVQVLTQDELRTWRVGPSGAVRDLQEGVEYARTSSGSGAARHARLGGRGPAPPPEHLGRPLRDLRCGERRGPPGRTLRLAHPDARRGTRTSGLGVAHGEVYDLGARGPPCAGSTRRRAGRRSRRRT